MKSLYVRNGILKILSDGRLHTMSEISEELEVNRLTVYRHITALTPYYNITSFKGRYGGGVKMLEAFDTYIVKHVVAKALFDLLCLSFLQNS